MHRLLDRQTGCHSVCPAERASTKLQANPSAMPSSESSADNKGKLTSSRPTQTQPLSYAPMEDRVEGRLAWQSCMPHDQLFNPVESWPTPSAAAWSDIQTVASRAFFTLEWILAAGLPSSTGSQTSRMSDQPDSWMLMQDLAAFLQRLLAGHALNVKLDMSRVCTSGLAAVLQFWLCSHMSFRHVNHLALLLLKRIATDEGLRSSNDPNSQMYKREMLAVILVGNLLLSKHPIEASQLCKAHCGVLHFSHAPSLLVIQLTSLHICCKETCKNQEVYRCFVSNSRCVFLAHCPFTLLLSMTDVIFKSC